jgi:hypothetical protein
LTRNFRVTRICNICNMEKEDERCMHSINAHMLLTYGTR